MIQRIQSIYLLLTAILMAVTVFSPLLVMRLPDATLLDFSSCGVITTSGDGITKMTWGILTMAVISALLAFINIFLYKKRKLQIRTGYITSLFIVLFYITSATYFYFISIGLGAELSGFHYGVFLPFAALVFNLLAIYRIKKDESLVKSLDRIR